MTPESTYNKRSLDYFVTQHKSSKQKIQLSNPQNNFQLSIMNYSITTKSKDSTIMVYPANGYMGYMICKALAHGSHHHNGRKMEVKKVLAVCCGTGGMHDKLKDMEKPIKTIVLDDASRMSEWKEEMKDRKCDAMMLCAEGAPHHHIKAGMTRGDENEHLKKFVKSMENALEMTRHMNCKTVAMSAASAADESKYKTWNHIYKAMEKASKKHFKGNCATLFHNMMIECLYLSRDEIKEENMLTWPAAEDAKVCPMSAMDFARCCIAAMEKMMRHENKAMSSQHHHKNFRLTGREKMTLSEMVETMSGILDMELEYKQVDRKEWKRMMEEKGMLSPMQICLEEEVFEMMEKGDFKKCTDECEKLIDRKPMKFEEWLEEHRDMFERV